MFCDLADTQSFTKAAQINGVTQSAISQQMTMMERAFKSLLVERSKKKFRLTPEGQVLYDYGKQILQLYGSLDSKLLELKDVISGSIRVATIYSIGLHDLPPYIKKFMKNYPTVNVHVEYRSASQVYEDVVSNTVDLGLIAYPLRDSKLEIVRYARNRSCWSATRNTPSPSRNPSSSNRSPARKSSVLSRIPRHARHWIKF